MISETVIAEQFTDNRNNCKHPFTECVIYPDACDGQRGVVLTTVELLARLKERGVRNHEIAKTLDVSPSRVTEMRNGDRLIKLDEAAKLVAEFQLDEALPSPRVSPLPAPIARLVVAYVAAELGLERANPLQVAEIAEDVRAFAEFVSDPAVRESIDAAETFFQAMRLRRPRPEKADPPGIDSPPVK